MRLRTMLSTIVCLSLASSVMAADKLEVGHAAPGLDIEEWVKGSETSITNGSVYVVEFWATWCAPCRKAIPHLTKLQDYYGDDELKVIGVSTEELDTVKTFVKRQGERIAEGRRSGPGPGPRSSTASPPRSSSIATARSSSSATRTTMSST